MPGPVVPTLKARDAGTVPLLRGPEPGTCFSWDHSDLPSPDLAVTYLNGAVLFVSGLSVILYYNRWSRSWIVLITILGWLMITVGLGRMVQPTAQPGGNGGVVWATEGGLFMAGMVLCWRGYVQTS